MVGFNCDDQGDSIVCEAQRGEIYRAWTGQYSSYNSSKMWCPEETDLDDVADNISKMDDPDMSNHKSVVKGFTQEGCKKISIDGTGDSVGYKSREPSVLEEDRE